MMRAPAARMSGNASHSRCVVQNRGLQGIHPGYVGQSTWRTLLPYPGSTAALRAARQPRSARPFRRRAALRRRPPQAARRLGGGGPPFAQRRWWSRQAPACAVGFSQPTVLPSGQTKIGCWPGCLSLQPATLQSPALTEVDTPANTERPNTAVIILLMIILLQGAAQKRRSSAGGRLPLDVGEFLHRAFAGGAPLALAHVRGGIPEAHAVGKRFATATWFAGRRRGPR